MEFPLIVKILIGIVGGFFGTLVFLVGSRWWPTTYVDTRDLPKGEREKTNLRFAAAGAVVGGVMACFF